MQPTSPYPEHRRDRDQWILQLRTARRDVNPFKPHGFLLERERSESGEVVLGVTVFLTNRECPWRCLMCDLWKTTLPETVPVGAIPGQIDEAFQRLGRAEPLSSSSKARLVKLYNSGSFFDARAIPPADYQPIAQRVCAFDRVVVECHPALVGARTLVFRDLLLEAACASGLPPRPRPQLEVAMGLETVHPQILERLNKRMTLEQFARAAAFLRQNEIALRTFVLVKPPFLDDAEGLYWAERSVDFAFDQGATVVSLIPTRAGNGALEFLQRAGQFSPPKLATLESALAYGISLRRGRAFADLWDLEKSSDCARCFPDRLERLRRMNIEQAVEQAVSCPACGAVPAGAPTLT